MSNTLTTAELRAMLAASEAADAERAEADAASARVADVVRSTVDRVASLVAAAEASGLTAPDLATILASAMTRAVPADPSDLASVVAPDPDPAPNTGSKRRTRRAVVRTWADVPRGSVWLATLAGETGKVRVTPRTDGVTFTVVDGPHAGESFASASRAVQRATGDPAGRGRRGEATVNGFLALTRTVGRGADAVTQTLDEVTRAE